MFALNDDPSFYLKLDFYSQQGGLYQLSPIDYKTKYERKRLSVFVDSIGHGWINRGYAFKSNLPLTRVTSILVCTTSEVFFSLSMTNLDGAENFFAL